MADTQRSPIDNVVPGDAPHCGSCRYYELATGGSPAVVAMIASGQVHMCLRYKDAVTGEARAVQCVDARADERLCGAAGRMWAGRVEASTAVADSSASGSVVDAPRRGRPPKAKVNGLDVVI